MANKKLLAGLLAGVIVIGGGAYAFNASSNNGETLRLGINAGELPYYEFAKKELKKEGVNLEIKVFDDYVQPNLAVANGNLDINAFQHLPYLNEFKDSHKNDKGVQELQSLAKTIVSPLRLYSNKYKDLASLKKNATIKIAVPNDTTNEARALHLLESNGLIKVTKNDLTATKHDVKAIPGITVEIKELDAAQTGKVLNEVDASVVNGNFAQVNNVSLDKAVAVENGNVYHTFDNIIAGKKEITKKSAYKKFITFIKSKKSEEKRKEVQKYDLFVK